MTVYLDIAEVPVDEYSTPDIGDESPVGHETFGGPMLTIVAAPSPHLVIPFTRPLEEGDIGKDVIGAKRAIWRANGLHVTDHFTAMFGPIAKTQLVVFQKTHGLTADGVLGPATLMKLAPFFDRYAFLLYVGYPPGGTPDEQAQRAIVAYCIWGYNNRPRIHYLQLRPMSYMDDLEHLDVWEDCSTFDTKAFKFGHAPDPNGLDYNGLGNTVTQRMHGHVIPTAEARAADLAHYDGPQHVGVCVGAGRVIALGSEIGPLLLPIAYRPLTYIRRYPLH